MLQLTSIVVGVQTRVTCVIRPRRTIRALEFGPYHDSEGEAEPKWTELRMSFGWSSESGLFWIHKTR